MHNRINQDKALEESDESDKDQQQTKSVLSTPSSTPSPTSMSKQSQPDRKGKKTFRLEQALQEKETVGGPTLKCSVLIKHFN
jgi:hypothetical protein